MAPHTTLGLKKLSRTILSSLPLLHSPLSTGFCPLLPHPPCMALWNLRTFPPACLPGCPGQPVLLLVLLTSLGSIQERKSVLPLCSDSTHLSQVSVTLLTPVPSSGNPDREPHSSSGVHSVCSRPAYTYLEHFSLLEYGSFTHSACLLPVFSP